MSYTPATVIPTTTKYFQWYIPGEGVPRLTAPFASDDTAIYWSVIPTDHTGAIITGNFVMNIEGSEGVSNIYVPASAVNVDGLGATGVVHIRYEGLDYTTADTVNAAVDHSTDDVVSCCISPVLQFIDHSVLLGNVGLSATGIPYFASAPTLTPGSNQVCTVLYADNLAIAGSPDATLTTKGILEVGTTAEINAGTSTGGTGASLAVRPDQLASSIYNTQLPSSGQKAALSSTTTPSASNLYVSQSDFQNGTAVYSASTTGNDTYVATFTPTLGSLVDGMSILVKVDTANTGAATLNATSILRIDGSALATGDIPANGIMRLTYNSTSTAYRLQNPANTPKFTHNVTTRTGDTASGTQNIAHGLGRAPRFVWINAKKCRVNGTSTFSTTSDGQYDGSTTSCSWVFNQAANSQAETGNSTTNFIYIEDAVTGSVLQAATVTVDATNIILAWTKTSSPSNDNIQLLWKAEA